MVLLTVADADSCFHRFKCRIPECLVRAKRETAKEGRNRTRNADFGRFSLIFGSLCKSRDKGFAQKTADFRGFSQETADFCRYRFLPFAVSLLARSYRMLSARLDCRKRWEFKSLCHLRPVIKKPVGRIFQISDSNPILRKMRKAPLALKKNKGLRTPHRAKARKTREMRTRKSVGPRNLQSGFVVDF